MRVFPENFTCNLAMYNVTVQATIIKRLGPDLISGHPVSMIQMPLATAT